MAKSAERSAAVVSFPTRPATPDQVGPWRDQAERRLARALRAIRSLRRLAQPRRYTWRAEDVAAVCAALASAVGDVRAAHDRPDGLATGFQWPD